jgi:type IV pilus assembly protein PilB
MSTVDTPSPEYFVRDINELRDYLDLQRISPLADAAVPKVCLSDFQFPPNIEETIEAQWADLYRVVPLFEHRHNLIVAVDEGVEYDDTVQNIEFVTGRHVEAFKCRSQDLDQAIDTLYSAEALVGLENGSSDAMIGEELELIKQQVREKPIVRIVTRLLLEAYRKNASDIHIRPTERGADYLLRINGSMVLRSEIHKEHMAAVISRFKIIGGMNISEHRIPQDGGARIAVGGHRLELRMSIIPTIHGESLVVRLLNADQRLFSLEQLGLEEGEYRHVFKASKQSHGMVLVVGPTGSGKSTTLYALLQEIIENKALNVITVEDPVEFHIEGTEQIPINRKAGSTFPKALRNILRHDPDVIMVGEIRDEETAKIAIECGLTGHLVLSTLHCTNAVSAITRLLEMGVKPYLLKATLSLLVAQRLAKINCPSCMTDDDSAEAKMLAAQPELSHVHFKTSEGCEECNFTGISRRQGLYEALPLDLQMKHAISEGVSEKVLESLRDEQNLKTLTEHAVKLAEQGLISAREWIQLQVG